MPLTYVDVIQEIKNKLPSVLDNINVLQDENIKQQLLDVYNYVNTLVNNIDGSNVTKDDMVYLLDSISVYFSLSHGHIDNTAFKQLITQAEQEVL